MDAGAVCGRRRFPCEVKLMWDRHRSVERTNPSVCDDVHRGTFPGTEQVAPMALMAWNSKENISRYVPLLRCELSLVTCIETASVFSCSRCLVNIVISLSGSFLLRMFPLFHPQSSHISSFSRPFLLCSSSRFYPCCSPLLFPSLSFPLRPSPPSLPLPFPSYFQSSIIRTSD